MRYLILFLCLGASIVIAENKKPNILYNGNLTNNKTIIRNIKIKGCSKVQKQIINATLKISQGDIINLQSSMINNNIRNILDNCSFVQAIQCTFKKVDEHNIDLIFTVQEAPLIIDIKLNNIDNDDFKEYCKKDCFVKSCNDSYMHNLKQHILRITKKDDLGAYKVFILENKEKLPEGKNIIINKVDFFKDKTAFEILNYLSLVSESNLRKMFLEKYQHVKNILAQFRHAKKKALSSTETINNEKIISAIKDTKHLQDICNKSFVKIIISRQSSEEKKNVIDKIYFSGNNALKKEHILHGIGFFSTNNTCFKSLIHLATNLKIQNLFTDISSFFKTYFLNNTNPETIDSYKDKIINLYRQYGFINMRITQIDIIKNKKTNNVRVQYHIDEGQQFFVNSIKIEGNKTFPEEYLLSLIKLTPGDVFNIQKLHDSIFGTTANMMMDGLKTLYNNRGLLNCNISIKTKYTNDKVDISLHINEGEKSKIGIVRVYGNKYTDENYFKSYTALYPSEDFAIDKLALSQQSLAQSEILIKDNLLLNPVANPTMPNTQDIDCTIKERFLPKLNFQSKFEPELGGSGGGAKIFLVAGYNNLNFNKFFHLSDPKIKWRGKRHTIELEVSIMPSIEIEKFNKHTYNITVSSFIPETFRILNRDVGFGGSFSATQSFSTFDNDEDNEYTNNTKEIIRNINLNTHFSWNNFNRTTTFSIGIVNINYKWNLPSIEREYKSILDIPISVSLRHCDIDRSFFVTRGKDIYVLLSFPNPLFAFFNRDYLQKNMKLIFYTGFYIPVVKKVVLNVANYFGIIKSFSSKNPSYFRISDGILETYMAQIQHTDFFVKCIDEDDIKLMCFNKSKHHLADKVNCELRFKCIERPYFGFYVFGFYNGGLLLLPQKDKEITWLINKTPWFHAAGIGIKLNIIMLGTIGFAVGFDCNTGRANISFTLRQDFETIF